MSFFTSTIGVFLLGLFKDLAMRVILRKGLPLAMNIVQNLESKEGLAGHQKKTIAVHQLNHQLKTVVTKQEIKGHLLNLLIELAVLKVKSAIERERAKASKK